MWYKLKRATMRVNGVEKQVRPATIQLYYDFTQSDWWWTPYNRTWWDTYRDSDWWYRTNTRSDWLIIAPSEIYVSIPNKITITYTKNLSDAWIWCFLATDLSGDGIMASDYNHLSDFCTNTNWTTNYSSMWSNITWDITWEIDIDSSTTPRTVTHTFNSSIVINKNDWVMDNIWGSNNFMVRLCQWSSWTKAICFKTITFEY